MKACILFVLLIPFGELAMAEEKQEAKYSPGWKECAKKLAKGPAGLSEKEMAECKDIALKSGIVYPRGEDEEPPKYPEGWKECKEKLETRSSAELTEKERNECKKKVFEAIKIQKFTPGYQDPTPLRTYVKVNGEQSAYPEGWAACEEKVTKPGHTEEERTKCRKWIVEIVKYQKCGSGYCPEPPLSAQLVEEIRRDPEAMDQLLKKHMERATMDLKKPCSPYYESKYIKMTLVKEFQNEEEFKSYMKEHEIIKKRKRLKHSDHGLQLLNEEGNIIKEFVRTERPITEEEKKYARQKYVAQAKDIRTKERYLRDAEKVNTYYTYYTTFYVPGLGVESDGNRNYFLQIEKYGLPHVEEGHWTFIYFRAKVFDIDEHLLAEIENEEIISLSPDGKYMVATTSDIEEPATHVAFYDMKGKLLNTFYSGIGHSQTMIFSENGDYVGIGINEGFKSYSLLFNRNGKLLWKKKTETPGYFVWISDDGNVLMGNAQYINNKGDIIWHAKELGPLHANNIYINEKEERLISLGGAHNSVEIVLVDFKTGEILDEVSWLLLRGTPVGFIGHQLKIEGNNTKIYLYDIQY